MGTPRPTIDVDNLELEKRSWPKGVNRDYDNGSRYCFRIGKIEFVLWKWPWPEYIGLPTRDTLEDWIHLIYDWKVANMGMIDIDHVEKCVRGVINYV
jgi:hypothetical protein